MHLHDVCDGLVPNQVEWERWFNVLHRTSRANGLNPGVFTTVRAPPEEDKPERSPSPPKAPTPKAPTPVSLLKALPRHPRYIYTYIRTHTHAHAHAHTHTHIHTHTRAHIIIYVHISSSTPVSLPKAPTPVDHLCHIQVAPAAG
jgi:hypothetical protein